MDFNHADILKALPHRPPFLFIDQVIDISPGQRGTGVKRLCADELLLATNTMMMPNIIHLEIMAQTTAIIFAAMTSSPNEIDAPSSMPGMGYLAGGDLHFTGRRTAQAGDTLLAKVEIIKQWSQYILAKGALYINNEELSQGRFTIALAGEQS